MAKVNSKLAKLAGEDEGEDHCPLVEVGRADA